MKSVFTFLWCLKLNFDANCVYITSHIFDILVFLWLGPYGYGIAHDSIGYWPYYIYVAVSIVAILMAVFSVVQLITKSSSASQRSATYAQARLYTIIGLALAGIALFVLFMVYHDNKYYKKANMETAFQIALPLVFDALLLHSYHENFL